MPQSRQQRSSDHSKAVDMNLSPSVPVSGLPSMGRIHAIAGPPHFRRYSTVAVDVAERIISSSNRETVILTITPSALYVVGTASSATVTITDNDAAPVVRPTPGADTTAPSVPTNLLATATSASKIDLDWTDSTDTVGVTGYKIFRNGSQVGTSVTSRCGYRPDSYTIFPSACPRISGRR